MIAFVPSPRLLAVAVSTLLIMSACGGPGTTPGATSPAAGTPEATPGAESPEATPGAETPEATPGGTPDGTPEGTPAGTPEGTPAGTPEGTPAGTPEGTPGGTPEGTPSAVGSPPSGATGDLFALGFKYTEGADEIATERLDYFTELNPDVNITYSETDFDEAQFLTALQTDAPPDVVSMPTALLGTYAARGVLQPVDDCMAQHGVDPNNIYDAVRNQATIDGQMYGIPEFMTTMNWLVDENVFADAGLDPASIDFSDWDAIRAANTQLMQVEGDQISRIGIDPKVPEFLPLWAKANGVDMLSADGMTAQLDQPQVVEALQLAVDLINAHGSQSAFTDFRGTFDFFGENNQFAADQIGAFAFEQWYLNQLIGASPDAGVRAVPFVDRQGNGLTMATGASLAIPTAARNPEAACALIVTMTHEAAWLRAAEERKRRRDESGEANTGVFIANRSATERIFSEIVDVDALPEPWGENVQVYLDNWENAFAIPASPAWATIFFGNESIVAEAVARALDGEDPQTVLTEANAEAQAAIDEAAQ